MLCYINALKYKFFYIFVAADLLGNKYYKKNRANCEKRAVLYKNEMDPSKLPADWYYWLHYLTNEQPQQVIKGIKCYETKSF